MKQLYLILIILLCGCFSSINVLAQTDRQVILGGVPPYQLQIVVNPNGQYIVNRWINNAWRRQFFATNSHLFAIRIGTITFSSGAPSIPSAGNPLVPITPFTLIEDVGTAVTTGVQQEMTKRFTGNYRGNLFSVTIRITYNTSSPEYFIKHATIDATNIPADTPITLAYGWDTFVNLSDAGFAYIVPDIFGLNNNPTVANRHLTTAQVQSLRMVGARNNTGDGALIAFFPIGRNFDRAYSANPYNPGYSFNIPTLTPGNGTATGNSSQFRFQFGPFSGGSDNGTGVGYDNIPAGQITQISTGLTFTTSLDGELDYFWNGVKDYTANVGDNVYLNLNYLSHNAALLNDVGFRVDFPGLQIRAACISSGFLGGNSNCTVGNEFFQLTGASVPALGDANVSVPVNITRAGQWVIDGSSITHLTQTIPLGNSATLTVATTVGLADSTTVNVCKGSSEQFTVQFPDSIIAAQDVTVNLTYSGAIGSFSFMPDYVIIPAGQNSATFYVTASPVGVDNAVLTVTLSSTNQAFASIAGFSSIQISVSPTFNLVENITIYEDELPLTFRDTTFLAGTTSSSHIFNRQTMLGCDSIVTLNLTVIPLLGTPCVPDTTRITAQICQGETYIFFGTTLTTTGTFEHTLVANNGCDSTIVLNLVVNPTFNLVENITIYEDELPLTFRDTTFLAGTTSSNHIFNRQTMLGCDSIVTLNLTVIPLIVIPCEPDTTRITAQIFVGEYYSENGFWIATQHFPVVITDTLFLQNELLCDSLVILTLTVIDLPTITPECPEIIIPSFFTPNRDGWNDKWLIENIECYLFHEVNIYDRFGKLLGRWEGNFTGWDGTYLGRPMPTTDYWYLIRLYPNDRGRVGHFTLIRR